MNYNTDIKSNVFDLKTASESYNFLELEAAKEEAKKKCSELKWYKRWWNTIKGWFGDKPTNCEKEDKKVDLVNNKLMSALELSVSPRRNSTQRNNTPKKNNETANNSDSRSNNRQKASREAAGSPNTKSTKKPETAQKKPETKQKKPETKQKKSETAQKKPETAQKKPETAQKKPETAKKSKDTKKADSGTSKSGKNTKNAKKASNKTKCSKLAWYKRWWNTVKGWFGSKPTNCEKDIELLERSDLDASKGIYLCSKIVWYKRYWNEIKGFFGSKNDVCVEGIMLDLEAAKEEAKKKCSELVWYKRWWNTIKGWVGDKPTNCEEDAKKVDLVAAKAAAPKASAPKAAAPKAAAKEEAKKKCSKLAWYKRWWNTIKGWFGSKPTNCTKELIFLSSESLPKCSKLAWYKKWWNTIKGWFGSKVSNCAKEADIIMVNNKNEAALYLWLTENPVSFENGQNENPLVSLLESENRTFVRPLVAQIKETSKVYPTFFKDFSEVFRNKGLLMEDYKQPVAEDLLEKIPSFVDGNAANAGVKFLDNFERAKSTILANDIVDKQFLNYVERFIMTWAIEGKNNAKFSEVLKDHIKVEIDI